MSKLQSVQFETCQPNAKGTAQYVIEGDSCIIFHLTSRPFSVNAYMEDVMEAINKHEAINRFTDPPLQFYELQVRSDSMGYEKGKFFFMMVWENWQTHHGLKISWYDVRCPPYFVEKYKSILRKPPVQCIDVHYQTFEGFLSRERVLPTNTLNYEFLEGIGIKAYRCNEIRNWVVFILPGHVEGIWEPILGLSEDEVPPSASVVIPQFKKRLAFAAREFEARRKAYLKFSNFRAN